MTNYQVTIMYKAIITVNISASDEEDAKEIAITEFEKQRDKMFKTSKTVLEDDNYKANGVLDMDATWNQF